MKKLDQWEVLSFSQRHERGRSMRGKAIGRVASPPEAVLHTFLQLDKYKHWLPQIKGSRIVRRRQSRIWAVLETELPWPVRDAWVYYVTDYRAKHGRVYEVRWKMINGTMKRYSGVALIEPWSAEAHHSVLTFDIRVEVKTAAPASVVARGVRKVAEVFVHRLRMRTKALRRFGKLPANLRQRYDRER